MIAHKVKRDNGLVERPMQLGRQQFVLSNVTNGLQILCAAAVNSWPPCVLNSLLRLNKPLHLEMDAGARAADSLFRCGSGQYLHVLLGIIFCIRRAWREMTTEVVTTGEANPLIKLQPAILSLRCDPFFRGRSQGRRPRAVQWTGSTARRGTRSPCCDLHW